MSMVDIFQIWPASHYVEPPPESANELPYINRCRNYEEVQQTTKILSCLFWRNYSVEMHRNLLFINHDANSLGRRNDIQLINAHVQKYRRTRRRRIYREISCSLPVDELRIVRERKKADSRQSSPCHQASRSAAVESVSIFNIRNIGKSIDPLCSLVSSECDWLSETLDYCETISIHNAWCCG